MTAPALPFPPRADSRSGAIDNWRAKVYGAGVRLIRPRET